MQTAPDNEAPVRTSRPLHRDRRAMIFIGVLLLLAVGVGTYSEAHRTAPPASAAQDLSRAGDNMRQAGDDLGAVLGGLNNAVSKH